jgi:heterodisulfide reductase subunit B2
MAVDAGANCVVVACPLCQQNLDLRQGQVNSTMGSSFNLPVIYFSQIMGLAYGYSPKELGMDKLIVSADEIVRSRITVEEWNKAKEAKEAEAKAKAPKARKAEAKEEGKSEEIV